MQEKYNKKNIKNSTGEMQKTQKVMDAEDPFLPDWQAFLLSVGGRTRG